MQTCDLNYLMDYFNVKICAIWEGIATTRREILIEHMCSLGFQDMREGMTLQG